MHIDKIGMRVTYRDGDQLMGGVKLGEGAVKNIEEMSAQSMEKMGKDIWPNYGGISFTYQ